MEEGEDYIRITPPAKLQFAEIGTYNDHRMAMCFSLVALSDTPVTILDPKCTAKTFPDYFEQLGANQYAGLNNVRLRVKTPAIVSAFFYARVLNRQALAQYIRAGIAAD